MHTRDIWLHLIYLWLGSKVDFPVSPEVPKIKSYVIIHLHSPIAPPLRVLRHFAKLQQHAQKLCIPLLSAPMGAMAVGRHRGSSRAEDFCAPDRGRACTLFGKDFPSRGVASTLVDQAACLGTLGVANRRRP